MESTRGIGRRHLCKWAGLAGLGALASGHCLVSQGEAPPKPPGQASEVLVRGATLLTMDPNLGELAKGDVWIRGGRIERVGAHLEIPPGAELVEASGMILMPGLVDAHWHMWNSLARNAAPGRDGERFFEALTALSQTITPEQTYHSVWLSLREAVAGGITTVNNWAHNIRSPAYADAELRAMQESGLRGRLWYGYPQDLASSRTMDFRDVERLQIAFARAHASPVDLGIAVRGPERSDARVWEQEFAFARDQGLPVSTHISVTPQAQRIQGIRQLAERGLLGPQVQLVHATHADDTDLRAIAEAKASVCLTPITEMRAGFGLPPLPALRRAGIPLSLGIDTLVLAGNADPFRVLQTTLALGTALASDERALTPEDVLHWATQGGADEMGIGALIGSITPGKRADLILIDANRSTLQPMTHAAAAVVQSATPADVVLVLADGRAVKRGRQVLI